MNEKQEMIGGEDKVVEIDESLLAKRKYHRGRVIEQVWMFGGVERDSNSEKFFIEIVPDRTKDTLVNVIKRRVREGTTIMSDMWRAYNTLENEGYIHYTVNHSENFINPANATIHTQTIESFWSALKKKLRAKGTNIRVHIDEYLLEYMYRKKFRGQDLFEQLILDTNNEYSINRRL